LSENRSHGFETQPGRSFLLLNKFHFLCQIIFKLYLWTVSMNMWFGKQIVMTQFWKMFKIRFPAVINISIYKTTIKKSSHILSIYFCRCKQFNISIQQYSCIAFYRLNKFKFLTTHYICIQLSTLIQRWINVDCKTEASRQPALVEYWLNNVTTKFQRWINVETTLCVCWVRVIVSNI